MKTKYNIFGSHDSTDVDIMVFTNVPSTNVECKYLIKQFEEKLQPLYQSDVNVNLAQIENGVIVKVYKGTIDECNNSVYYTYPLHKQEHPLQVTQIVERDVTLKLIRSSRILLSFLSRTQHREVVKRALKGDFKLQLETLRSIDLSEELEFSKPQSILDIWKTYAFQLGQASGLARGFQLYTKKDVQLYYQNPLMDSALMREDFYLVKYEIEFRKNQYCKMFLEDKYKNIHCLNEKIYVS